MEPLITNRLDSALLRVIEKRGNERDSPSRRRRQPAPEKPGTQEEADTETTRHEIDDLA